MNRINKIFKMKKMLISRFAKGKNGFGSFSRYMILIFLVINLSAQAQRPEWAGIWGIWGGHVYSRNVYPWYKGTLVTTDWRQIQPQKDAFDFSSFDDKIYQAYNNDLYIMFLVYIAPNPPEWLNTELGVPFFRTSATYPWVTDPVFPYYLDSVFEEEFKKMIDAVAAHVDAYPDHIRNKIIAVQTPMGKSGDEQPYDGIPDDPKYAIDVNGLPWRDYNRRMLTHFREAYKDIDPSITLLIKPRTNNWQWALENMPNTWRKTVSIAQGYHLGMEMQHYDWQKEFVTAQLDGYLRGEFDLGVRDNSAWYRAAPIWNAYWSNLWCLTFNMDVWNMRTEFMDNPHDHITAMEFFSKWAGYKKPEHSIGAWAAFRDDIDYDDMERFPEAEFGQHRPANQDPNQERFDAIAAAFAPYGAKQDDPQSVALRQLEIIRNQNGLNDVQWRVWRGNYRMHLYQVDANETSQGYWRVGSKDQPYGRFARGFNPLANKNAIYLNIDDNLFNNQRSNDSIVSVEVEVIYFDSGNGSWDVRYDSWDNPDKKALSVMNTNTGRWKTISFTLDDARFSNLGPRGSDISIVNADDQVNIFHMLKILKKNPTNSDHSFHLPPEESEVYCYPNPFNPGKGNQTISWPASGDFKTQLNIYNLEGKLVRQLSIYNENSAGKTHLSWDGRDERGNRIKDGFYVGELTGNRYSKRFKFLVTS